MNSRFVTSLSRPYFAMMAENVGDVNTLPADGLGQVHLEFRVEVPPQQHTSADELHPLFAFTHDIQTQPAILEVGITPSGRVKATAKSGHSYQSRINAVRDPSSWNSISVAYGGVSGVWAVNINSVIDTSVVDPSPVPLLPNAGYQTRLMLFNGRDGLSRYQVSVRYCLLVWDTPTTLVVYDFQDDYGDAIEPDFQVGSWPSDLTMRASVYNPLVTAPWGPVPAGPPTGFYRWGLTTDYTRLAKPQTQFTRVPE